MNTKSLTVCFLNLKNYFIIKKSLHQKYLLKINKEGRIKHLKNTLYPILLSSKSCIGDLDPNILDNIPLNIENLHVVSECFCKPR